MHHTSFFYNPKLEKLGWYGRYCIKIFYPSVVDGTTLRDHRGNIYQGLQCKVTFTTVVQSWSAPNRACVENSESRNATVAGLCCLWRWYLLVLFWKGMALLFQPFFFGKKPSNYPEFRKWHSEALPHQNMRPPCCDVSWTPATHVATYIWNLTRQNCISRASGSHLSLSSEWQVKDPSESQQTASGVLQWMDERFGACSWLARRAGERSWPRTGRRWRW